MTPQPDAPSEQQLKEGLSGAFLLYLTETDLSRAVGENGRIYATVEVHLERGRARWTKGAVYFERRVDLGGSNGR